MLQPKNIQSLVARVRQTSQGAIVNRIHDLTSVFQGAPTSHTVPPSYPTRVHKPRRTVVRNHLRTQHLSVVVRMPHQKRSSEASAERRSRLRHPHLRPRHLRRVPGDEMVHRLLRGQTRHGRKHTKCIASQHHNVRGMALHCRRNLGIGNVLQRIRTSRVLCHRNILVVHLPRPLIKHHVLQHSTVADRVVDLRLLLSGQIDALRVAAPLDVEHTLRHPDMLVITHQESSRVRGQRCLPSSRQTEEQRHIPFLPHIARRMERQRTSSRSQVPGRSKRHQIHHHRQHTLLHLPRVLRSQNDHLTTLEVDRHTRRR
mmetsp:Transcript_41050/g.92635  ORF Transcript_41050/g.92635 Transcript_41050/m.92635 type:complete len:314 (-) Transcript_41050:697-1638(-)